MLPLALALARFNAPVEADHPAENAAPDAALFRRNF
jgi:hypothetical protein